MEYNYKFFFQIADNIYDGFIAVCLQLSWLGSSFKFYKTQQTATTNKGSVSQNAFTF